ncbi:hypothetical protein FRB95_014819 [Tulasnella sp. JGI-2019a]|nr:hypothetical protein FRB95_014819 [Tulasnella sp. JGI-2019a]
MTLYEAVPTYGKSLPPVATLATLKLEIASSISLPPALDSCYVPLWMDPQATALLRRGL